MIRRNSVLSTGHGGAIAGAMASRPLILAAGALAALGIAAASHAALSPAFMAGLEAQAAAVTEGAVRVTNGGSSVRVKRGQQVSVSPEATPSTPTKLSGAALRSVQSSAWTLGRPRLKLGLIASGGLMGSEVGGESHTFVTVQVLPHVNLVGNLGLGFASNSSLSSSGLGLEFDLGGWSLGGSLKTTLEQRTKDCGAQYKALHLGGTAHGRFTMNITRRFFLAANAQIGANGSGYTAAGGLGAGVSL